MKKSDVDKWKNCYTNVLRGQVPLLMRDLSSLFWKVIKKLKKLLDKAGSYQYNLIHIKPSS